MSKEPQLIKSHEDGINEYYYSFFEGEKVQFCKNKFTGEVRIDADDVMKCLGTDQSFNEFLGSDNGLDFINEWSKDYPDKSFFGNAVVEMKAKEHPNNQ